MINLYSYFTDKKYGRHFGTTNTKSAYEHIANPKNASMAACIHLEVIKRVMSSSSSSSSPPCFPFFPSLVGLWDETSQHHQFQSLFPRQLQFLPNHGLRLDPAVHACDPLHHPLGKKEILKILHLQVFLGSQKKTQYFTWISSSPVIGFLLFFGGILADF